MVFRIRFGWLCVNSNVTPCHTLRLSKNFFNKYFETKTNYKIINSYLIQKNKTENDI